MANIAVHGFSNLSEKLVVALVHPDGGNLNWLGVANQDMHHFQLRNPPKLPKVPAPVPAPLLQPSAPIETTADPATPQPEGVPDPFPQP